MKAHTHPLVSNTLIQMKDGSSYVKYWLYLRSPLVLETDSKIWESSKVEFFDTWTLLVQNTEKSFSVSALSSLKNSHVSVWGVPSISK